MLSSLSRRVRIGRLSAPVWLVALASVGAVAAAGQAVGPVLAGSVTGTTVLSVQQALVLSSHPAVNGAIDGIGVRNDDGTSFTAGIETHLGEVVNVVLPLSNRANAQVNAIFELDIPAGTRADVEDCGRIDQANIGKSSWLVTVPSGSGGEEWDLTTADSAGSVGQYSSLAVLDPCLIFISYQDATNIDLRSAKSTDGGATWTLATVDSAGFTGQYTSIAAVDASTVFISYYDVTNIDLRSAKSTDGGATWTLATVDSAGSTGAYTSIAAVDASTVFISYYDVTNFDLRSAKSTDGGATWTLATVDSAGSTGQYTSIAAVDASTVFISYYDATNSDLRFAYSGAGLEVTVKAQADAKPGYYTATGRIVQFE